MVVVVVVIQGGLVEQGVLGIVIGVVIGND